VVEEDLESATIDPALVERAAWIQLDFSGVRGRQDEAEAENREQVPTQSHIYSHCTRIAERSNKLTSDVRKENKKLVPSTDGGTQD
jgi:hypothetical protein